MSAQLVAIMDGLIVISLVAQAVLIIVSAFDWAQAKAASSSKIPPALTKLVKLAIGSAEERIQSLISAAVKIGYNPLIIAAVLATSGAAKEVPAEGTKPPPIAYDSIKP